MGEQGGESEERPKKVSVNYVDSRIIITATIVLLLGIIFVLVLILFGIHASQNYSHKEPQTPLINTAEPADESILVEYEELSTNYSAAQEKPNSVVNSLMHKYGIDDAEYAILHSAEELDDFVNTINTMNTEGATPFIYSLDPDFFKTGTVIVISKEGVGLDNVAIDSVSRDKNYNIHIIGHYTSSRDVTTVSGRLSFLQIQNIQPKTIELKWR